MLKRFFDVTFFSICVNLILPVTVLSVQFLHICISLQNTYVTIVGRVNSRGITYRRQKKLSVRYVKGI